LQIAVNKSQKHIDFGKLKHKEDYQREGEELDDENNDFVHELLEESKFSNDNLINRGYYTSKAGDGKSLKDFSQPINTDQAY
jgi:hypothetical protein